MSEIIIDGEGESIIIDAPQSANHPGGSDTEFQFNDGGSFGGSPSFTHVNNKPRVAGLQMVFGDESADGVLIEKANPASGPELGVKIGTGAGPAHIACKDPTEDDHAATKLYVDTAMGGGVSGPVSSVDKSIAIWDGVGGDTLADADQITISEIGGKQIIQFGGQTASFPGLRKGASSDLEVVKADNSSNANITVGGITSFGDVNYVIGALLGIENKRVQIGAPAGGVMRISSTSGFSRVNLGGDTASFPSVKRSGAEVHIRTATDGAFADLQAALLTANSDSIRITTSKTPASASGTGTAGQIAWDSNYIYVCVATDTWKRVAISSW
jgi:hypothetical protein